MTPKTFFFDIDGTLLSPKGDDFFYVRPKTKEALLALKVNGHRVAICSGRQQAFIRRFFPGTFESFVAQNGAHVVLDGETVYREQFAQERVRELQRHFDAFGCSYIFVGDEHGFSHNVPRRHLARLNFMYGIDDFLRDAWKTEEVDASMMDFVFETDDSYERCKGAFTEEMVLNRHPGSFAADLSFKGLDKANGIAQFLQAAGLKKEDTIAFGDGYNDITMMGAVGLGVAMGNAVDDVKAAAGYITKCIDEDGIYEGLKYLGYI